VVELHEYSLCGRFRHFEPVPYVKALRKDVDFQGPQSNRFAIHRSLLQDRLEDARSDAAIVERRPQVELLQRFRWSI
jgi:hypothetical protein